MQAAFFDLDKTVIARPSVVAFGKALYHRGFISRRLLFRALFQQLIFLQAGANHERMEKIRANLLTVIRGWDRGTMEALVREGMHQAIDPIIYAEALELLAHHRTQGRKVVIISSSPEEIVLPLAEFLNVDLAIATRACVDERNRYTGELEFYAYGAKKVEAMEALAEREGLDLASSYAYSDSQTDLPMLRAVGNPVAVNPDSELRRVAERERWEILDFTHPVQLRESELRLRFRIARWTTALTGLLLAGALFWIFRIQKQNAFLRASLRSLRK